MSVQRRKHEICLRLQHALAGSPGIAPIANLDPERRFPSMFEPIHGSAFDIAGKGIANPIGTFWSATLMLEHLGEPAAAARLMRAIERVTAEPALHTPDLGGTATVLVFDSFGPLNKKRSCDGGHTCRHRQSL